MATALKAFMQGNDDPEINWKLVRARASYWGWQVAMLLALGLVFMPIVVQGLRVGFPTLATRILGRMDMAVVIAWGLLFFVPFFWKKILQLWLGADRIFDSLGRYEENHKVLVTGLGGILLFADGYAFFSAIADAGDWDSESSFSFSALMLTAGYMAMVISMSYFSLLLRARLETLEGEE